MDIAKDSINKIKRLEFVVNQLQSRISQIAGSYELEIAVLKATIQELKQQLESTEEVD